MAFNNGWDTLLPLSFTPHDWLVVGGAAISQTAWYLGVRAALHRRAQTGHEKDDPETIARDLCKAKAWTLSLLNAAVMSAAGIYFVPYLAMPTLTDDAFTANFGTFERAARPFALWFYAFLVLDLGIGVIEYPVHLNALSGYLHHAVYLVIVSWLSANERTGILVAAGIVEVPTFLLALGSVQKAWRTDLLMGGSFFVTRVLFCAWYLGRALRYMNEPRVWMTLALVLALHCWWFWGWAASYTRLRARQAAMASPHEAPVDLAAAADPAALAHEAPLPEPPPAAAHLHAALPRQLVPALRAGLASAEATDDRVGDWPLRAAAGTPRPRMPRPVPVAAS